jgi:hypothetical protein
VRVSGTDFDVSQNARNQVTPEGDCAIAVTRNSEEKSIRHIDPIWACHGLVRSLNSFMLPFATLTICD